MAVGRGGGHGGDPRLSESRVVRETQCNHMYPRMRREREIEHTQKRRLHESRAVRELRMPALETGGVSSQGMPLPPGNRRGKKQILPESFQGGGPPRDTDPSFLPPER